MKRKLHLALATIGVIALTAPAIASSNAPTVPILTPATYTVANTVLAAKSLAVADSVPIAGAKGSSDPAWKTIAMTHGVPGDDLVTLKTALVDSSAQGGGGSGFATTLAAGTGSHTSAPPSAPPANGYTAVDLATLTKPERSAVAVITA